MKTVKIYFKALLFSALLLSTANIANAQEAQTLFDGNVSHGGFGGPVVKISDVAGKTGVWVGGRGGWIINMDNNHSLSLGGGGYGLVTEHLAPEVGLGNLDADYFALNGYGGFEIEYTNRTYKLIHFTASSLIGAGGLMLRDRDYHDVDDDVDTYFVFEPGINAELNVTKFFRVSTGVSYRLTSGIDRFGFSDSDFSGINGVLTFKFGGF